MATKLTRPVTRETSVIDHRTNKPLIIRLEEGGKIVRMKIKGERNWYTITIMQIYMLGASNKATEIKQAKAQAKADKKANKNQ